MHTLQEAEQNGARSKISGKSTCLFTFRRLKPAFNKEKKRLYDKYFDQEAF